MSTRVKVYRSQAGHTWVAWCPCCPELSSFRLFLRHSAALAAALDHIRTHHQEDQS